ncbi:DUF3313 family protein [Prosthecobacter sp.]|uniref:DUF3313 family protein n=1 Tax=Prosthecobacter sp. TaxID=1965333 RepID=UPI00378390D1
MNSSSGMKSLHQLLLLGGMAVAVTGSLCSCRTVKNVFAATQVQPSGFLTHKTELRQDRKRSPFIGNWWSKNPKLLAAADRCRKIYIAPVVYDDIRADQTVVSRVEHTAGWRKRHLPELAQYTHAAFEHAFRKSRQPRYAVVAAPAADALTLELSLLEWGPNTYTGLIVREVVGLLTFEMGTGALLRNTRGYIAIEGRLVEPRSRQPVFEFADKEYGKIVLLISLQDFRRSGQAHAAIQQWASQLERLLRAKPGEKVKDSLPFTIVNF